MGVSNNFAKETPALKTNDSRSKNNLKDRLNLLRPAGPFLLAIVLSSAIWVINSLNKNHSTSLELKLEYPYAGTSPVKGYTKKIKVDLSGVGFDLIRFYLSDHSDEIILRDTGAAPLPAFDVVNRHLISTNFNLIVTRVTPSWIDRPQSHLNSKQLKVIPDAVFTTDNGFLKSTPVICIPDSITVYSESAIPKKLTSISTSAIRKSNLNDSWFGSAQLNRSQLKNLIIETDKIWIYQPVEEATECTLTLPVNPGNGIPYNFRFIPASVQLTCIVPLSLYTTTTADKFVILGEVKDLTQKRAVIRLIKSPSWAVSIRYTPSAIDFLRVIP